MNGTDHFDASELVDSSAHADNPRLQPESGTLFDPLPSHRVYQGELLLHFPQGLRFLRVAILLSRPIQRHFAQSLA